MKKFLVFLVTIVVAVSLGLTTFYFLRNDEVISIKKKEIFCNVGDIIPLDSLEISRKKAHRDTEFNYNAGGDDVLSMISYDAEANGYIVNSTAKGDITLVITTTNEKFSRFEINVHVGNGSETNPYYIFGETEMSKIGRVYDLGAHYILMNDIYLSNAHTPIGYAEENSVGFSGSFDGNGYAISGLNVNGAFNNAGLFYTINSNAKVVDLTINSATISGSYNYAGVLAGEIYGTLNRVRVENPVINNDSATGATGAIAGVISSDNISSVAVESGSITVANGDTSVVGGFAGRVNKGEIKACYVNDLSIQAETAKMAGGFAGEMIITSETGSIQQSYANVNCGLANFGAFVGKITGEGEGYDNINTMLRHLIGNIAIVKNAETITDNCIVNDYNNEYFIVVNEDYTNRNVFYNTEASLYMVSAFTSVENAIASEPYNYYAIDSANIVKWDTDYLWNVSSTRLPTLTMVEKAPSSPAGEYFMRDMDITDTNEENVNSIFSANIADSHIVIPEGSVLELNDYTPVELVNSIIDGNGATIRVNIANNNAGNLGLFAKVDNSTIRNLNVVVTGIGADATNGGALAGEIMSSDAMSVSNISNVKVVFENAVTGHTINNFGGLVGVVHSGNISNISVEGLNVSANSEKVGGIAGNLINGTIDHSQVNATITGNDYVGGVVGYNNGSIQHVSGTVTVKASKQYVGGIAGSNAANIYDSEINLTMAIENVSGVVYAGGVAGNNSSNITNVQVYGAGIAVNGETDQELYIGGITAENNGTITYGYNLAENVGSYHAGKRYYVGGFSALNNGVISKSIAGSNLYGNYVAGLVVDMKTSGTSIIDQALVGKYDINTKAITENHIMGDNLVAGVAVNLSFGTISNIQAVSRIEGTMNETRSSLIVLIFPAGATINGITINNAIVGAGTKYRESWTDYGVVINNNGEDTSYNIYDHESSAGVMINVVINTSKEGVGETKNAMGIGNRFMWIPFGDTYNGNSYAKYTDEAGFNNSLTFSGEFEFNCAYDNLWKFYHTATATLSYDASVWSQTANGIALTFVI